MKVCRKCGKELEMLSQNFGKNSATNDGFMSSCKACRGPLEKQYYQDNKESVRSYQRNNIEFISKRRRAYRQSHNTIIAEKQIIYREVNKEALREQRKKEYLIKHPGMQYITESDRVEKKRLRVLVSAHRRNAKKKQLPHTLTSRQWGEIKLFFSNKCAYCGKEGLLQQEHYIPLSRGGEYAITNIIPACRSCNCRKGVSIPSVWYPMQPTYTKAREDRIKKHLGYKQYGQQLNIF